MGIPLFFKTISDKYPDIIVKKITNNNSLFLDLNCAIHPCCRNIMKDYSTNNFELLEKKMINETINYIKKLTQMVNPKLLYIAIDGVAPCAKMNQQRFRRYKSAYEKSIINSLKEKCNEPIEESTWNTNAISPGTKFMSKLSQSIKSVITNDELFSKMNIYFSDSSLPGEGEHKILDFIRNNEIEGNIVIYGLDADLIMLAFVSNKDNIYLLRESLQFGKVIPEEYLFLNIDALKYFIIVDLKDIILQKDCTFLYKPEYNKKLINDYIFLCILLGNDFLPHLTSISLRNKNLGYLLGKYMDVFVNYKMNLIEESHNKLKINNRALGVLFKLLSFDENDMLLKMSTKRRKFRLFKGDFNNEFERLLNVHNNSPILNQYGEDYIDIGTPNWESRYYEKCLNIKEIDEIDEVVQNYVMGLKWVFEYYYYGCSNFTYKYNYLHSPTIKDIYKYFEKGININSILLKKNKPYNVIVQMLAIFPKSSSNLIPLQYRELINSNGILADYYPDKFECDTYYKRYFWECEPVLPLLDFDRINKAVKYKNNNEKIFFKKSKL